MTTDTIVKPRAVESFLLPMTNGPENDKLLDGKKLLPIKVVLHDDLDSLRAQFNRKNGHERAIAATTSNVSTGVSEPQVSSELSVSIHLCRTRLNYEVVSHESTHAALRIFTYIDDYSDLTDPDAEERISWLVGNISERIHINLKIRGL